MGVPLARQDIVDMKDNVVLLDFKSITITNVARKKSFHSDICQRLKKIQQRV